MSGGVVSIQLGQCGNQIGCQLFSSLVRESTDTFEKKALDRFFRLSESKRGKRLTARAVLVDMEPKAVQASISEAKRQGQWVYDEKRVFCRQSGSANNWAHGYCKHGDQVKDKVIELVRKESEACDELGSFVIMQSLAGGTGSGLGTCITEALRDTFSNVLQVNQVVWPYETGEVIVQNYNSILTLSHLYEVTDGVLVVHNEHINDICTKLLSIKRPSFAALNTVIAKQLTSVLLPTQLKDKSESGTPLTLDQLIAHLFAHPGYKMSTLKCIPQVAKESKAFTSSSWSYLMKHLIQMQIADAVMEEGINWRVRLPKDSGGSGGSGGGSGGVVDMSDINKSVASVLTLRGLDANEADFSGFGVRSQYARWNPEPLLVGTSTHSIDNDERCASVWSNCQSIVRPLDRMLSKAWDMFQAKGYIHHYCKEGLEEADFHNSFALLEQALLNYQSL